MRLHETLINIHINVYLDCLSIESWYKMYYGSFKTLVEKGNFNDDFWDQHWETGVKLPPATTVAHIRVLI